MSARMPGPLRRLLRQPLRAVAIGLLGLTALASAGIHSAASAVLQQTLDENWRGTYDILVTPRGAATDIDGALPPNTLSTGPQGLTVRQWEQVSELEGVEVAAPIGEVLAPAVRYGAGSLVIPAGAIEGAESVPQGFRIAVTYTTDDGLGERIVDRSEVRLIVDERADQAGDEAYRECLRSEGGFAGFAVDPVDYPELSAALCAAAHPHSGLLVATPVHGVWHDYSANRNQDHIVVDMTPAPLPVMRIALVDPAAERALLGEAGAFLDPLLVGEASARTSIDDIRAWADSAGSPFATELRGINPWMLEPTIGGEVFESEAAKAELERLFRHNGADLEGLWRDGWEGQVFIPVLVAEQEVAPLTVKIDIFSVGSVEHSGGYELLEPVPPAFDAEGTPIAHLTGDVSALLNPLGASAEPMSWPGTDAQAPLRQWQILAALHATGKAEAPLYERGAEGISWAPGGYALPVRLPVEFGRTSAGALAASASGEEIGAEAAYTVPRLQWEAGFDAGVFFAPLGTFDAGSLAMNEAAAIHVPLGAYDPVGSTVTGGPHAGATMSPGVSGFGLVSARTAAIASIHSAGVWQDTAPISAIRVRVAGVDAYTAEGRDRVLAVAQEIEGLGFSATVVAGSSPTDIGISVDGYAFGAADPAARQTIAPLGTITQRWSELGAAARVSLSIGGATLAILGIALAASVLLLGAVQIAGIPGRREQAAIMREGGFTRGRIARWFAAEEAPGIVAVALIGAAAIGISGGTRIAQLAAVVVIGVVLLAAVAGVVAGSQGRARTRVRDLRSRRLGARSIVAFGARQSVVHPLTSLVHLLANALVGLASAALAATAINGWEAAGSSNLALLALSWQLAPQLALGVIGVLCSVLLARLTRRIDLVRRSAQWSLLRAAGWTSGQLRTAQRTEGVTVIVPALAIAGVLAWLGASWSEAMPGWLGAAIAIAAGLLAALLTFSAGRKGDAP